MSDQKVKLCYIDGKVNYLSSDLRTIKLIQAMIKKEREQRKSG